MNIIVEHPESVDEEECQECGKSWCFCVCSTGDDYCKECGMIYYNCLCSHDDDDGC